MDYELYWSSPHSLCYTHFPRSFSGWLIEFEGKVVVKSLKEKFDGCNAVTSFVRTLQRIKVRALFSFPQAPYSKLFS